MSNQGWGKTGAAAIQAMKKAEEEQKKKAEGGFMPLRMWVPKSDEVEIIILDEAFLHDEPGVGGLLVTEHNLRGTDGNWGHFESCCADFANCPLCDKAGTDGFGASQLIVMMTCLVLKEWTNKKTGQVHPYSRMLLPVKMNMKEKFLELQKHAFAAQGSMRGMYLVMRRGADGKSSAIGEPAMLDNGKLFDFVSEEELVAEYGHDAVTGRDGKILKPANGDLEPFDYAKLFPRPDPDDLARRFGGRQLGSRRSVAEDWDDEQAPAEQALAAAPSRRRGVASSAPAEAAAAAPARRRGAAAPAPAQEAAPAPARRRGAAPAPADAPAAAPARRRGGAAPATNDDSVW